MCTCDHRIGTTFCQISFAQMKCNDRNLMCRNDLLCHVSCILFRLQTWSGTQGR